MASKITITFNSQPAIDTALIINDDINLSGNLSETFKALRTQQGESTTNVNVVNSAWNYGLALGIDYNVTSLYTIAWVGNIVTITANNANSSFVIISNTTGGAVTTSIDNTTPQPVFSINSLEISEAVSPCDNFKATVTTSTQADSITSPFSQVVTSNPFVFESSRQNSTITVTLEENGVSDSFFIRVPLLLASYFKINKVGTPSNAAISVEKLAPLNLTNLLNIEYSLDDIIWQSSGYFNNLRAGDFTLYIRDQIGCNTTKTFSIGEFTPNVLDYNGIAEISNLNSIRYKLNESWSANVPKTADNTLSFEEALRLPNYGFTQPFIKDDIITTQIRTNYKNITAKLIDDANNEVELLVSKKTANMNITDVRDVNISSVTYNGAEYVAIKYSGGKTYNPITLAEESDYDLGEGVPEWINKDDYLNIQGVGWYKVLDIVYSVDAYVVVINLLNGDIPFVVATTKASTVYNALDYENYEFEINFLNYEGFYKVQVDLQDDGFGSEQYLSEWLSIKEEHLDTILIEAYNTENNEINYNTGIKNKLRVKLAEDIQWKPNSEIEVYVTDTNTVNLDTKYRGFWNLSMHPLPTVMAEKLVLFLLQDRLFINTVNYISEGEPESNPVGGQYQIKANLVKSNYVYELYSGKGEITIETTGIPLSINPDGGFLLVE